MTFENHIHQFISFFVSENVQDNSSSRESSKLNVSHEVEMQTEMQYELLDVEDAKYYKGKFNSLQIIFFFFNFRNMNKTKRPKRLDTSTLLT